MISKPEAKEEFLQEDVINIAIQVNGKLRSEIQVSQDAQEDLIKELATEDQNIKKYVSDSPIKKVIYIPRKLINIVI